MTEIKILSVCGSGTVSSAMVGERIVELLEEHGYEVAFTSPIDPADAEGIPQINSVGLLTGLDEETFLDAALAALKEMGK